MNFFIERGCRTEVDGREGGRGLGGRLVTADKERQRREKWERINGSKYNRWKGEGRGGAGKLKEGMGESKWKRVARFRLGNEMRGSRYWE